MSDPPEGDRSTPRGRNDHDSQPIAPEGDDGPRSDLSSASERWSAPCQEYKSFIIKLAKRVASAHKESGPAEGSVSDPERAAIDSIAQALG